MMTVDLCHKFQVGKCGEHGDMHAHLNKLLMMHEDLASKRGSIDEDFTSNILGSIPPSCNTYITAITTYIYPDKLDSHVNKYN